MKDTNLQGSQPGKKAKIRQAGPEVTPEDLRFAVRPTDIRGLSIERIGGLKAGAHLILSRRHPADIRNDEILDHILALDAEVARRGGETVEDK